VANLPPFSNDLDMSNEDFGEQLANECRSHAR